MFNQNKNYYQADLVIVTDLNFTQNEEEFTIFQPFIRAFIRKY